MPAVVKKKKKKKQKKLWMHHLDFFFLTPLYPASIDYNSNEKYHQVNVTIEDSNNNNNKRV